MDSISVDEATSIMTIASIHMAVRNVITKIGGNDIALPDTRDLDEDIALTIKLAIEEK